MKTEDLKAKGLTEEQIQFVMAENGKDVNGIKAERDTYKTQLDTASATLKTFEGVNIADLQGKITQLTGDLAQKDTEIKSKLAEIEFSSNLEKTINSFGPRNSKAVMALLDVESLKGSKNQDSDIKSALEAVKKENAYLFQSTNVPQVVSSTPGPNQNVDDKKAQANQALRGLFGKE